MNSESANRGLTWIAGLLAVMPLLGFWFYGLFDLDEGFYAAAAAEMNRRGEWITPYYNGSPWFEKPILMYWLAKPSIAWFGFELGPRMPSVLAAICTFALLIWFCRHSFGLGTAQLAPVILGSSLLFVAISRMLTPDTLLTLSLTASLLFFWKSLVDDPRWRWASGFCLGLSVLAKGPVGIAFFVVIVIAFAIWTPSMRTNLKAPRGWLGGFVLMVLVIATWYGPAYAQNGQLFVEKFLVEQNLRRFQGGDEAHTVKGVAGLLYYVPIFLLGFAPWWFWLLRRPLKPLVPLERYLVVWAATVFIFFTISGSKLPHYIVPMLAPCALLVAYRLARQWDSEEGLTPRQLLVPGLLCVGISVVAQAGFQLYYHQFHAEIHALGRFTLSQVQTTESIATYRMSRQSKDKGTGRPEIQETSHPSLVFYLNRVLADPKDLQEVSRNSGPTWILTRKDRIQPIDVLRMSREGRVLRAVQPPFPLRHYALWKLEATPSAP